MRMFTSAITPLTLPMLTHPSPYRIRLPGHEKFWTVTNKAKKVSYLTYTSARCVSSPRQISLKDEPKPDKEGGQLWKFEWVGDLPK